MFGIRIFGSAALALSVASLTVSAQPAPAPAPAPVPVPMTPPMGAAAAPAPNAIAATVNGQPIYEVAVQRGLERVPPARQAEVRPDVISFLVDNVTVDQYVTRFQIKVEPAEADKKVEEIKAKVKMTQNKEFDKFLAEMKLTEAELREHVMADLRWEKFATSQANDKVLKDLFDANKDMFDDSMLRARHILLSPGADPKANQDAAAKLQAVRVEIEATVKAKLPPIQSVELADKARAQLIDETFAAKAKEVSVCPSKQEGGDVGWFRRAGVMVEPFAKAAFATQTYQMTDVVKSQFGYHLILVTDRKAGREVKFADVKEAVKEVYFDKLRDAILAQERPKAKIEIMPVAAPMK